MSRDPYAGGRQVLSDLTAPKRRRVCLPLSLLERAVHAAARGSVSRLASGRIHGLWRTRASTDLLYSLVAPDSVEGTQCVKAEGSRTTCPRQLFAEESSVDVASTVDGDRGTADVTWLWVLSQTARTGLVAVRSEEAGSAPFRLRL